MVSVYIITKHEHHHQDKHLREKLHTLTQFIHSIDISMTSDEFFHHSLYRQPCSQDQCSGAIVHTGVKIRSAVSDQNLGEWKDWVKHYDLYNLCAKISYRLLLMLLVANKQTVYADDCLPGRHPVHLQPQQHVAAYVLCCPERWHLPQHPEAS